jgi:hypothetical protein
MQSVICAFSAFLRVSFKVSVLALIAGLFVVSANIPSAHAATGINQQINFQGRLLNTQGAAVADGNYNIQFKIYQDGAGTAANNPGGTVKWTENWTNQAGKGVQVKNGYMSVQLGAINPFGTQVDWNQDTLWLSINIGNTNATCTPVTACGLDGEMLPMKRLSSTPFAMNSQMLGGMTSADFLQIAKGVQTDASNNTSSIYLNKTGTSGNFLQLQSGGTDAFTINSGGDLSFGANKDHSISVVSSPAGTAGKTLTFAAGSAGSTGSASGGGTLVLQGGNAGGTGNANGGNITLSGGAGVGTGASGLVVMTTPTYQTAQNDANCYSGGAAVASSCTITLNSINNSSAIIVGFSADGMTATMPDPTITTAGRVIYVTAANGSKDFTLSVNAGGQGNQIAMRQNTTATMIWNGNDWTAAGASSSTTLQAAYDNTLQSAGGAELVVSKTGATNGLTIRDSATNPVNGTLLTVQTQSAAGLISVNSNVTEYATNAGAETAGANVTSFPANTWSANAGATVSRNNVAGNTIATGQGSVKIVTPATANTGVKNQLSSSLGANTTYNVSFATRLESGTFTDLSVYYSVNGTALSVPCAVNESAVTSVWKKINCTFTTPSTGITTSNAIMIVQASAAAHTFFVDNLSVTIAADYNFATDGNVNNDTNFSTNWSNAGTGAVAVTRDTTDGYNASDSARANITTGAANAGIRNRLSSSPLPSTLYRITVYAKAASTFADFKVRYSPNGGTNYTDCVDYNTQNVSTTSWTKITCYIQTPATTTTTPYVYFVEASSAVRSFSVDAFNMSISTITTPNVQVGGGVNGGPTTLFTLDKGASAPIASDNDALLGSMYYDTTLGKLQCYEADGWGACGSSPDNIITISPEYTNAVLHGTGIGTMTSDLCSSTLGINDGSNGQQTICGSGETYNFYKWTSPQASAQQYSIYVTYQLPATFKEFNSGQTSLMARSNNGSNGGSASVDYQVYRNAASSGLTPCGSSNSVSSGTVTSWQTKMASGAADPSTCGFAPGDSIVFKITVSASRNATAYVGNLNFAFSNR